MTLTSGIKGIAMNIFDFDGTIHRGDSSVAFYLYCLRKRPYIALLLPVQAAAALLHALRIIDVTSMKQTFYQYFRLIDAETMAERFWEYDKKNILSWYRDIHSDSDVLISASPEFMLKPVCRMLGIRTLIASKVDPRTGRYSGKNCSGQEKVRRFREVFPDTEPENSYYDRDSDLPLSHLAKHGFRIVREKPIQEF